LPPAHRGNEVARPCLLKGCKAPLPDHDGLLVLHRLLLVEDDGDDDDHHPDVVVADDGGGRNGGGGEVSSDRGLISRSSLFLEGGRGFVRFACRRLPS